MKKTIICILFFLLTLIFLNSDELDIIQGEENIETVIKSKPISILLTTNNTMYFNENFDLWLKQFNQKRKDNGEKELDKDKMIEDMQKQFGKWCKNAGKKWGLKLLENKDEANEGYIIHINIDQIRQVPMVTYSAKYSVTAYKVGSDDVIFKVKFYGGAANKARVSMGPTFIGLPKDCFREAKDLLQIMLPAFLRRGKDAFFN